jgi:2-desacetyl-2-hydroxyethyl bacteriochlorophyllide A dehydrogenase
MSLTANEPVSTLEHTRDVQSRSRAGLNVRAAVLEGPDRVVARDVPPPRPAPGEVLIAVDLAGICGSDVALLNGKLAAAYPLILGHEAIGHVVDPGPSSLPRGAAVVIEPNFPCRSCAVCRRGNGNVCAQKRSLGVNAPGLFAELAAVPAEFVHHVPATLAPRAAVLIEPLAVALHAFSVAHAASGDRVAVIGCGTEGLLLIQILLAMGASVLAVDVRADSLACARQLGVQRTLQVDPGEPTNALAARITADESPTVVFEAAGAAHAVELALAIVARGGRLVLVGLSTDPVPFVPVCFVRRGITLLGSLIYDHPADFTRAIELLRTHQIEPATLVGRVEPLEAIAAALQHAASGQSGKVLLDICGAR